VLCFFACVAPLTAFVISPTCPIRASYYPVSLRNARLAKCPRAAERMSVGHGAVGRREAMVAAGTRGVDPMCSDCVSIGRWHRQNLLPVQETAHLTSTPCCRTRLDRAGAGCGGGTDCWCKDQRAGATVGI